MSSVPVSQYEALRAEMRSLVQQAQQVQEIATQVISSYSSAPIPSPTNHQFCQDDSILALKSQPLDLIMEPLAVEQVTEKPSTLPTTSTRNAEHEVVEGGETITSEDECGRVSSTQMSVSSEPIGNQSTKPINSLYHGTWPVERSMWNSEHINHNPDQHQNKHNVDQQSVLSFASSSGGAPLDRVLGSPEQLSRKSMQQFEAKVDMVYSLLAMLGGQEHADMGDTLLALSTSPESCLAMRQSGCIPLLVQLVQSDKELETRRKASQALHNLVHAQPDERLRKRETRVLKLLEQARKYTEALKNGTDYEPDISSSSENQEASITSASEVDNHPVSTIANLMKHSFDEGHRQAICQLGGIHIIASLVEVEHALHGSIIDAPSCVLLRRYACMALTNLTFGDGGIKALLCSFREFMRALVIQLQSPIDELRQVTASVLRNLSWRADPTSKEILREVGTVAALMKAGMATTKENTLKSILSALWNLSAHCPENKLEICAVESGLGFLIDMISYKAPSKSLTINENAGGILRNISSQIAVRDDYREILRKYNCLQILLDQLKSPSLTIVSNACGTLWNLSAKNQVDQEALWQMGAPAMLRSLNHSKHKMIATGSSAALKNLLSSRPSHSLLPQMDSTARAMDLPVLPTLGARKQKALMRDLDQNLSETFENTDRDSPTKVEKYTPGIYLQQKAGSARSRSSIKPHVVRSESHEFKTHSEKLVYEPRTTRSSETPSDMCNGFASLNINEPSTSYQKELRSSTNSGSSMVQGYGAKSLSYVNQRKTSYTRSKDSVEFPDEVDASKQPVEYNRKYVELTKKQSSSKESLKQTPLEDKKCDKDTSSTFGTYTETDLDQPTDYSLRYAENDSDDDKLSKDGTEYVGDTLKTYCTEGTPYETPLNFSNATSMSDLRIDNDKSRNKEDGKPTNIPAVPHVDDEKDHCSVEDISDLDKPVEKSNKSDPSSGLMSPEKPINYCEEGTPGYFSRVSSFGSLNSIPVGVEAPQESGEKQEKVQEKMSSPNEGSKAVKFIEPAVNYAEQTPLMFSRSSSLASLGSVEQHSIHDDRSSVVSDFSRLNSGIISPSDIPDSPSQTVPPSPKPRKTPLEFPSTSRTKEIGRPPLPLPRNVSVQRPSVFEDIITKFKEESTPIQFSTATSISSLTIDDQDESVCDDIKDSAPTGNSSISQPKLNAEGDAEKQDVDQEKLDSTVPLSENEENEDLILEDCIRTGMQNNRYRQSKNSPSSSKIPSFSKPVNTGIPRPQGRGIPLLRKVNTVTAKSASVNIDTVCSYSTEDTPAVLSRAGSNSNLSVLSMQTDAKSRKDDLSDDSSNLSGDNENLLAECIKTGMAKTKAKRQIPGHSRILQTSTPIKPFAIKNKEEKKQVPAFFGANDEVSNFAVENSPCQFSVGSSLSDLTVDSSLAGLKRTEGEGEAAPLPNKVKPESFSSVSMESGESFETEQALLEQCISAGMPKRKQIAVLEKEKPIGVATKQFNMNKIMENEQCSQLLEKENSNNSKNVNVASVAGNIEQQSPEVQVPATVADVDTIPAESIVGHAEKMLSPSKVTLAGTDISPDKSLHIAENLLTDQTKSGSDSAEELLSNIDNRMLDPDAMIESLDRFTAELVSQASTHLQNKEEIKCVTSVTDGGGDTWNDDTSPNDVTFPSISGSAPNVITFSSSDKELENEEPLLLDEVDGLQSNDFSSINTSTLTESTLIAMEATKMATTFKNEAELSLSITSAASLELDQIQPPSQMNSLTSSALDYVRKSPKLLARKRSLPAGLMVKRALSNSLNQCSSLESLDNNSLSNLDHINPPSAMMGELIDMEGSMISVASIEIDDAQQTNGKITQPNPIFNVRQPVNILHLMANQDSDLENINPPSIFNEITDMCNSLADIETEEIEATEIFEDCTTTLKTDATEFSDATSLTPIQSDLSSIESTPKKSRVNRQMTPKQKRNLVKERYKTYTVAAEKMMECMSMDSKEDETETESEYKTVENYSTATYTRSPSKTTPKERRQNDRSRFETQVLDKTVTEFLQLEACNSNNNSPTESPTRTKISIRKNFNQKRLENKDRFKTQTITESSLASPPINGDLHYLVEKEANVVLKTLSETKSKPDELLDCETLSLVSNEDDSEHNSGSSMNYRTYHKSWGNNIPVVQSTIPTRVSSDVENYHPGNLNNDAESSLDQVSSNEDEEDEAEEKPKPKIVKPSEKPIVEITVKEEEDDQPKGIRGRRKPLYSKANANNKMQPSKTLKPSNLVKNVTSSLKSTSQLKKPTSTRTPITQNKTIKPPTSYGKPKTASSSTSSSPKGSPKHTLDTPKSTRLTTKSNTPSPLERQGTFTKDEKQTPKTSRIPSAIPKVSPVSRIAKAITPPKTISKIAAPTNRAHLTKSASSDRANKSPPTRIYNRSPSADSRVQTSNLKNGAVKKPVEPTKPPTNSKQITSRIASLWKKVEENKKQIPKKDTRVWIKNENDDGGKLISRSNTFESKEGVVLRQRDGDEVDESKRLSRLGSFLVVDEDLSF